LAKLLRWRSADPIGCRSFGWVNLTGSVNLLRSLKRVNSDGISTFVGASALLDS
jgi:hypothetical protein